MKKLFTTLFFACLFSVGYGQNDWGCTINFETNPQCYTDYLWIDSISDTNNIWQIGAPQKILFNSAYSPSNVIITDTINPYPTNDTSMFYILHPAMCSCSNYFNIQGRYKINTDGNDYGKIEFSPDNGVTWIDSIGGFFTGTSNTWQYFQMDLQDLVSTYNIDYGDTVLYRFTFISDSVQTNNEGWMIDDILLEDYAFSIEETFLETFTSTLYPNPSTNSATIEFENPTNANFSLQVFDITGRTVIEQNIKTNRTQLNTQHLPPGIYQYRLISQKERRQSFGKFVVK